MKIMNIKHIIKNLGIVEMLALSTGAIIAHSFSYVVQPIITRIYSPEALGANSLILSYISMLLPIITLQYERLIPVVDKEDEWHALSWLSLYLILILSPIIGVACIIISYLFNQETYNSIGGWYFLIIPGLILNGIVNVVDTIMIRIEKYKELNAISVFRSLSQNILKVLLGIISPGYLNLIFATFGGELLSVGSAFSKIRQFLGVKAKNRQIFEVARKYKKQIFFSTPGYFSSNFAYSFIPSCIITLYGSAEAGYYALASTLLMLPLTLVSESIGKVFIRKASKEKSERKCFYRCYGYTTLFLAALSICGFSFLYLIIDSAFLKIFGDTWQRSVYISKLLIPLFSIRFVETVMVNGFLVAERQEIKMYIQFLFIITIIAVYFFCKIHYHNIELFLKMLSASYSALYILLWLVGFRLSGFSTRRY